VKRRIQAMIAVFGACVGLAVPSGSASATPICHARSVAPSQVTVDRQQVAAIPVGISTDCVNFGIVVAFNFDGAGDNAVAFSDQVRSGTTTAGGYPVGYNVTAYPGTYTSKLSERSVNGVPAEISFTPSTTTLKYAAENFIASSRAGTVVSINGLLKVYGLTGVFHGYTTFGFVRANNARAYLQRYLNGAWRNVLAFTADAYGRLAVRFVQPHVYTPDLYVVWHATSASAFR
jgi:hypothetical protein